MTSSNSALTSELNPTTFRVGFGNLLDDSYIKQGALPQQDRIPNLAKIFNQMGGGQPLSMAGWCEGASAKHLYDMGFQTNMTLAHEPVQYSPREWMAIAIDPTLKIDEPAEFIRYGKNREGFMPGFLAMKIAGVRLIVVHHPHHIFGAIGDRKEGTKKLLEKINPEEPTIVVGDFNTLSFQHARSLLTETGLVEVHSDRRPIYPNPGYRGISYPYLCPSINLDAMHVSPHFIINSKEIYKTDSSDHPQLYAELELVKERRLKRFEPLLEVGSYN